MRQVLWGVEPVMQPKPNVNEGGDCFACSTLAVMRHFFPEDTADTTVEHVVKQWFTGKYANSDKDCIENTFHGMYKALYKTPFSLEVMTDPFIPMYSEYDQNVWGLRRFGRYGERVEAYLSAGWLALASIHFTGAHLGLTEEEIPDKPGMRYVTDGDHFVVVDGIRSFWLEKGDGDNWSASLERQIHIACSVKGAYWQDLQSFTALHGGAAIWWVRPRDGEYVREAPAA